MNPWQYKAYKKLWKSIDLSSIFVYKRKEVTFFTLRITISCCEIMGWPIIAIITLFPSPLSYCCVWIIQQLRFYTLLFILPLFIFLHFFFIPFSLLLFLWMTFNYTNTQRTRSTYQPQLRQSHLYSSTISKQHVLAKYWIESILGHRLPSNDLQVCLKDGYYLCRSVFLSLQFTQNKFLTLITAQNYTIDPAKRW